MPLQFTVPQFIDIEDKIFGPISVRQFVIILGAGFFLVILYFIMTFLYFIFAALLVFGLTVLFAFFKINGQYFHLFLLNLATTFRQPRLKLWNKRVIASDLEEEKDKDIEDTTPTNTKSSLSTSRLRELSLIVDTGGAYGEESWEISRGKGDII